MKKQFGRNKIIILLGAGASCDAGMFNSIQMIREIENKLDGEWSEFKDLYNYVQSSHFHLERIKGVPANEINFNIENLVGLLETIIKIANKEFEGYPFVGSWEKELISVAGLRFQNAQNFKNAILKKLKEQWLSPVNFKTSSSYYKKIKETGYTHPLKIFSLNYDMCVEENLQGDVTLERGFNDERIWDYRKYDLNMDAYSDYYLYKLHGSLDWIRDDEKRLTYVDLIQTTNPLEMEIIFGIQNKLQSYDPYLFYFYSFREACFEADLIVISGYGLMDKHINDNLVNAFKLDANKRLLLNIYQPGISDDAIETFKAFVSGRLSIDKSLITIVNAPAKNFFNENLHVDYFSSLFPEEVIEEDILPQ